MAVASYEKAMQLNPDHEVYFNYGNVLLDLKQPDAAISNYNKAIQLNSDYTEAYSNLGNALVEINQTDAAISNYNKAIQLNPGYAEAYSNLGGLLAELKQTELAITNYNKAIQLKPDYRFLLGTIFSIRSKICDWSEYDENLKKLEIKIQNKELSSLPFSILSIIDSLGLQRLVAEIYSESEYPAINTTGDIIKRSRSKKIRIGYFSADFRNHPVSLLTLGLYEAHDRSRFEIYAFSFSKIKDEITSRIEAGVDHFYDVSLMSDKDVVKLSRNLEIDIAVDLGGHTQYARTGIFAMRAAPIQVSYLGYSGTMGVAYIDYIIADKTLIPKESQKYYSEKIAYLPNSFQVNDSKRKISDIAYTKEEFELPNNGFIFCCFNNNYKITPEIFDCWMRILKAVDGSILWLFQDNSIVVKNLQREAEKRGIESSRLIFAGRMSLLEDHLARQKLADLFLDTLPYNAHTTCSDALWAGLPVLTLIGQSFASRVAASLLNSVNLPELITTTQEEYENLAIELATNSEKLKAIKLKLEKNRLTTPLFNTKIFTNHIESAYEAMYNRYQNDLSPDHIEVSTNNYN